MLPHPTHWASRASVSRRRATFARLACGGKQRPNRSRYLPVSRTPFLRSYTQFLHSVRSVYTLAQRVTDMLSVGNVIRHCCHSGIHYLGFVPWPVEDDQNCRDSALAIGRMGSAQIIRRSWSDLFSRCWLHCIIELPFILILHLSALASNLHFWLSAIPAFAVLLLVPVWQTLATSRPSTGSGERGAIAVLLVTAVSTLLFLLDATHFLR